MPSPSRTSLLENVSFGPDGAHFTLDGRPVRLESRTQGASVAALQDFHEAALADYRERLGRAGRRPTWWGRLLGGLGSWLGRLREGSAAGPQPPPLARPAPEAPPPVRTAAPAPQPVAAEAKAAGPLLRSVCADREGLHLVWRAPGGAGDLHATCDLDSPLGRRLHACYAQLEQLGYEVVGLDRLRAAPAKSAAPEAAAQPAAPAPEKAPAPVPAEAP
ncbi:MAG TPA: hypothetical protein VHC86_16125, partial [Opitutaceae bacterium]|nr:hypothetical protein [Opitutaceae bacterium]